jgi:signal transduction histidine kinase
VFDHDPSAGASPSAGAPGDVVDDDGLGTDASGERALQTQQALAELALRLRSDRPFDELLQLVTDRVRVLLGAHQAVTSQAAGTDPTRVLTTVSLSDRYARFRGRPVPPHDEGLPAIVRETNRSLRLAQAELESHPAYPRCGEMGPDHPPLNGWLAAPLVGRDGANLGVIQLSDKEGGAFTAHDEAMLVQVAQMAAAVIEDRLLREQLEDRVRELDASLGALRRVHEDRRRLIAQLVAAQEEERARLAQELHDDPVQIMTAVSMRLEILRRHLRADELPPFERLQQTVGDAIARLRRMMFELRPISLDDGLESALNHYLHHYDLVETGTVRCLASTEPPPEGRTILYRVAQEALGNIRKHAPGARFELVLSERDGGHLLEIRDDGPGFDVAVAEAQGFDLGLASMRERAELAGGWFVIHSSPGQGTSLRAWIPHAV